MLIPQVRDSMTNYWISRAVILNLFQNLISFFLILLLFPIPPRSSLIVRFYFPIPLLPYYPFTYFFFLISFYHFCHPEFSSGSKSEMLIPQVRDSMTNYWISRTVILNIFQNPISLLT